MFGFAQDLVLELQLIMQLLQLGFRHLRLRAQPLRPKPSNRRMHAAHTDRLTQFYSQPFGRAQIDRAHTCP